MDTIPFNCYLCNTKFINRNNAINKMLNSKNTTIILYCYKCNKSIYYIYNDYRDRYVYLGNLSNQLFNN